MENTSTPSVSVQDWPWMNTSLSPDGRAALLLAQMTLGWEIASGDYQVYVAASSRDIRLTGHLSVYHAEKK